MRNTKGGNKWDKLMYAYALVLFMMSFVRIFDNAFWGDEGFSIELAKMSVSDMMIATAKDVHPPLYYLLTQLLYHIFGNKGITYHLSAFLPYAVIMVMGCTIIKKRFGTMPSIIMITMASLMKNAIGYNVEARMYALAAMFMLIAYVEFYRIIESNHKKNWIVFCVASLGAAYTHYYALISVAFLYVMIIPLAVKHKEYRRGLWISYLLTIVGYLPWLSILLKSFGRTAQGWWLQNIPSIGGCLKFLLDYKWLVASAALSIAVYMMYQMHVLSVSEHRSESMKGKINISVDLSVPKKDAISDELYWALSGLISICGTVVVGLGLSYLIRPIFLTRYLFPVSTMLYLIIGVSVSRLHFRKIWGIMLVGAILCCNIPAYIHIYKSDRDLNIETAKFVDVVAPASDVEIVTNNTHLGWTLLRYYYPNNTSKCDSDAPMHLDTEFKDIYLIWEDELDENEVESIEQQQYSVEPYYAGYFANGVYYYVYKLHSND